MNYGHQNLSPVSVLETHQSIPVDHVRSTGGVFAEKPMVKIPLSKGKFALVDDEDAPELLKYKWHVIGGMRGGFYAHRFLTGRKHVYMHRAIVNCPKRFEVDHINRDTLDNRKSNLRIVDGSQQMWNRGTWGFSKYKGVYFCKARSKWVAQIKGRSKSRYIGGFLTEIDAALSYDNVARKVHGEFAVLNFPQK